MNFQQQSPGRNGSPFPVEKGLKAVTASSLLLLAACLLLGRAAPALNAVLGSLSVASAPWHGSGQCPTTSRRAPVPLCWWRSSSGGYRQGEGPHVGRDHQGIIPYPVPSDAD